MAHALITEALVKRIAWHWRCTGSHATICRIILLMLYRLACEGATGIHESNPRQTLPHTQKYM